MALELRPTALDDLGFEAAFRRYVSDFEDRTGVKVRARVNLERGRLDRPIETVLYRVLQEALTNVAKYAEAGHVTILIRQSKDKVVMRISDDGKGFDPDSAIGRGLGLHGMYERADLVGGRLRISSSPGRGTTVELEVPDKRPPSDD